MDYLAEHAIGVESSLTSNMQTSTVPDYASHPISKFICHGIRAIDIAHEYNVAAPAAGLSPDEIFQAQRNALD